MEMDDRNGLNVSEQVGPRYAVTETTNGVADLTSGVQGSVFGSEQFKVNKTFGSSMGWADFVKIRDIGAARESEAIKNAAINLAEKIDKYVMNTVVLGTNNWVGTAGAAIDSYDDFVAGYTRLKEEGVDDSDLRGVLTYGDRQALGTFVVALPAPDGMATGTFRKGFDGAIAGIPTLFTQQIPTLTVGSRTASASVTNAGAANNVNYADVAISAAPGQYMSQLLPMNITTAQTLKAGDVFTIDNVNAWDNRAGQSLGRLQQFTVLADVTAAASTASPRIFPAIIVPGTGTGDNVNINTAHATVDSVPADTAAITFIGTASTPYKARAIIQKQALVVNTADLIMPATGIGTRKALTKVPLSVRMWQNSTFATGDHQVRFDVALTANWRDRRRAVRLNGA